MDGYAVRAADTAARRGADADGVELDVLEDLPAGRLSRKAIGPGQAVRIMTGAPLPGAPTPWSWSRTPRNAGGRVMVRREVRPGRQHRPGRRGPQEGRDRPRTGRAHRPGRDRACWPRPAWPASPVDTAAEAGRHRHGRRDRRARREKAARPDPQLQRPGPHRHGRRRRAPTRPISASPATGSASLAAKLARAKGADILVLSGGVSVGDYDLVKDELRAAGVKPVFWQVRIKPGKPVFFGVRGRQLVFGLPGNPTSAMVTFLLFVRPAIDRHARPNRPGTAGAAGRSSRRTSSSSRAGPSSCAASSRTAGPSSKVAPYDDQRSGVLRSMVRSRVLIVVPADVRRDRSRPGGRDPLHGRTVNHGQAQPRRPRGQGQDGGHRGQGRDPARSRGLGVRQARPGNPPPRPGQQDRQGRRPEHGPAGRHPGGQTDPRAHPPGPPHPARERRRRPGHP